MNDIKISGAEALLKSLMEEGVDTIFGYPGGTIMPLYDKLFDYQNKINHILVRHEQGAVHAAEGYSRASGKVGVCFATAGPGATNLVTGIADALMDSTPIVCITAQVAKSNLGTNVFQEADTLGITNPITKWSYEITHAEEVTSIISKAFHIARSGRPGPVLVSITRNAQVEQTEYRYEKYRHEIRKPRLEHTLDQLKEVAELLNTAERPMIIVGRGVTISGAEEQLRKLAEQGNIPVVSSLLGISAFPTEHPLFHGNVGMHGNYAPNIMTQNADIILSVGMRFSDRVTGIPAQYAPKAKIVQIDIDHTEIGKTVKVDIPLIGDAKAILSALLPNVEHRNHDEWLQFINSLKDIEYDKVTKRIINRNNDPISMGAVVSSVSRCSGGKVIVVTDVGQHQMFAALYSQFTQPRSFITSGGLGTMGFGLPAAIGAKVAMPGSEVVLFSGDGGLQMSIQELGTIMQSNIGVKIVLLNNGYLGMVRQWQEIFFDKRYSFTQLVNPNFIKIAEAYGIHGKRVEKYRQLENAVQQMLNHDGPYILEVVVESEENVFPMVPSGASLDEILM